MNLLSRWSIGASILMYHSVGDHTDDIFSVTIDNFKRQIYWLHENGFEVISLSSMLQHIQEENYPSLKKKVVITFDDGYKDFTDDALPILSEYGATATVFLVTDLLGKTAEWTKKSTYVPLMSETEVRGIKAKGISLGSHTATHVNLTQVDFGEAIQQLDRSYDMLTELGETFHSFCYPWGQWSYGIAQSVKSRGYTCALAVGEQTTLSTRNQYCLPRVSIRRDLDMESFKVLMNRTNYVKTVRRGLHAILKRNKISPPVRG